jgi:photosystem II stability/assembly factor-like uncharacterized protein
VKFFFLDSTRGRLLRTERGEYRVLVTTTAGQTWQDAGGVPVPPGIMVHRLWFLDPLTGWILESGLGAQLHSTTDGGQSWRRYSFGIDPAAHEVADVHFVDRLQGWAVTNAAGGQPGLILRTTDGGQTWQQVSHPARVGNLSGVWFLTPTEGWVVGDSSTILKTTDGGRRGPRSRMTCGSPAGRARCAVRGSACSGAKSAIGTSVGRPVSPRYDIAPDMGRSGNRWTYQGCRNGPPAALPPHPCPLPRGGEGRGKLCPLPPRERDPVRVPVVFVNNPG